MHLKDGPNANRMQAVHVDAMPREDVQQSANSTQMIALTPDQDISKRDNITSPTRTPNLEYSNRIPNDEKL